MAQDPFSFYRGGACLFCADVADSEDRYADERTSRVWIHGDLHAENYGTHINAAGVLVFDINDFDEAYLGHFSWDLKRMAASLALLGFVKALSDDTIREMIETYARSYAELVDAFNEGWQDEDFRLTHGDTQGCAPGGAGGGAHPGARERRRAVDEAGQHRRAQPRGQGRAHQKLLRASRTPDRDLATALQAHADPWLG